MKKHMALRLLGITLALFIVYILAISACYHGMSRQANLVHHLNVVRNDATNIAEHYPNIAFSEDAPTAEYFLTLEDVTHGQLMLADGGEGVYRLDDNEEVTYCTLCRLPVEVADGARRALAGETVSLTLKEPDGGIFLYACVPVAGRNLAVILRTDANAIGDAVVSDTQIILVSGLLSLIVAGALAFFAMRAVTSPLLKLKGVADRLSAGDYSVRTGIRREDELGSLARTMDEMAEGMQLAQRQRAEMERQKDAFLSEISHELRTPVTILCASIEALQKGVADTPDKQRVYFDQMGREGEWLKKLVTDLLELTRLKNTAFTFEKQCVSLEELLGDVAMSAETLARKKGVVLLCAKPNRDYTLSGDYGRLRQMLINVIDNAVKFSPQGERVEVAVDEGAPVLRVTDRGPGIAPEDVPRLFDRFSRRKGAGGEGTGLGLAIARQVALRHGILIEVQSVPGGGTTFSFDFSGALCPM